VNTFVKKAAALGVLVTLAGALVVSLAHAAPSDFDGVWIPDVKDQHRQETENAPPWKPEILPQVRRLIAEEKAGRPFLVLSHCLPHSDAGPAAGSRVSRAEHFRFPGGADL